MTPIRVMHLITGLDLGGAETMLARLVVASDRDRFHLRVVSLTDIGPAGEMIAAHGIEVRSLGMRRSVPDPRGPARLVAMLRTSPVDVLQTWLYHADLVGTMASYFAPVPRLLWNVRCSNMDPRHYRWAAMRLPRLLASLSRRPDVVLANSEAGRSFHEGIGYRPARWEILPNGIDTEIFRPDPSRRARLCASLGWPETSFVICLPARFDPMKDHATFFKAAARFASEHDRVRFLLIGRRVDGKNETLQGLLECAGCGDRIVLWGERRDVADIFASVDIVTLCSRFGEGAPNVLAEAMACGTPVVSTDVGDTAQIVGDAGLIVPPGDADAIARAWRDVYELGPERRASIGLAARQRVVERYALPNVVARYEGLYQELVTTPLAARTEGGRRSALGASGGT